MNTDWSCRNHIQNGAETGIDYGTDACGAYTTSTTSANTTQPLKLWPNPFQDVLHVRNFAGTQVQGEVIVSNVTGQVVHRQTGTTNILLFHLPTGVYHVEIRSATERWVAKVVKQ